MSPFSLSLVCVWGSRIGTGHIGFTCYVWISNDLNFNNRTAEHSFLSLSACSPHMQHYWQRTLNSKSLVSSELDKSLRSSAASCSTRALSSFERAQSLNYCAKVKTGSPENAYLPGSLEAAQVRTGSWQSIMGHMGRAPEPLPATSLP